MKKNIKISLSEIEKLVKKIIKEDAGRDTPGGNPDYFYDDDWKKLKQKYGGDETEEVEMVSSEDNNIIKVIPYKGGNLVLEYETVFGPPKYVIYYEVGDESEDTTSNIIVEFDAKDLSPHSGTYNIIYTLSEILANDEELEVGEFELDMFKIKINNLKTYEGELIKCES